MCAKFGSDRFRNVDLYKVQRNKQTNKLTFIFICKIDWYHCVDACIGSLFRFGTLVLRFCRMWRSYLSTIITQVCRVWRSCFSFPYSAALLFLLLFLLQDTNLAIVSPSNHYQYSIWLNAHDERYSGNISRVPHSLHSWHCTLLFRLRLVVRSIHSVPHLIPSDIVHTDWLVVRVIPSDSYCVFFFHFPPTYLALHYLSLSPFLYSLIFL